jgi:hypothetical protein
MRKPKSTAALTAVQREERTRLKEISLKWTKIAREKAKEDFFTRDVVDPSSRYELDGTPPAHAISICLDLDPGDVELALPRMALHSDALP